MTKAITSNGTGNRGALVLGLQRDAGGTASLRTATCTYAGTSMTLVSSALVNGMGLYAWKLANPSTGTQNVVMTCTTNSGDINIAIIVGTSVDQTTTAHNFLTNSGNSTTGSVAVTGLGTADVAGAFFGSATAGAGWTNGTQDANSNNIGVNNSGASSDVAASYRPGINGTSNMTYSVTTGQWAAASCQLIDAGGGTTKNITVATTGKSAPSFTVNRIRGIAFATTGKSAPAFAMVHPVHFTTTGTSRPSFGLGKVGGVSIIPRWGWRMRPPTELISRLTGKAEGYIWKG